MYSRDHARVMTLGLCPAFVMTPAYTRRVYINALSVKV
nr:MAG TPA: hypothetical protein [Caudoviricetes sp.]DAR82361.1 MAG TPA: hypothetical protein [Caudoviricetes sp.]